MLSKGEVMKSRNENFIKLVVAVIGVSLLWSSIGAAQNSVQKSGSFLLICEDASGANCRQVSQKEAICAKQREAVERLMQQQGLSNNTEICRVCLTECDESEE